MKRLSFIAAVLSAVLFLSSCSILNPAAETDPEQPSYPSGRTEAIKPVLDPSDEAWSWGYTEGPLGDSWFLGGNAEKESFTVQTDADGNTYISFFDAGTDISSGESSADCSFTVSDMHMVNAPGSEREFDLVFTDPFTSFDFVSGEYYLRGDYVALFRSLTSGAFRNTSEEDEHISFFLDGTSEIRTKDGSRSGTWRVADAHSMVFRGSGTSSDVRFFYSYSQDGTLLGLVSSSGDLWDAYSETN